LSAAGQASAQYSIRLPQRQLAAADGVSDEMDVQFALVPYALWRVLSPSRRPEADDIRRGYRSHLHAEGGVRWLQDESDFQPPAILERDRVAGRLSAARDLGALQIYG